MMVLKKCCRSENNCYVSSSTKQISNSVKLKDFFSRYLRINKIKIGFNFVKKILRFYILTDKRNVT